MGFQIAHNLTGKRIGKFTVLSRAPNKGKRTQWLCRCECGQEEIRLTLVLMRRTRNSMCHNCLRVFRADTHTTHGGTRGGKTRLYLLWKDMRKRCRAPTNNSFKYYGGKGISVCPEWADYAVFETWARKSGYVDSLSIERKHPDKNYCPENCEWVTRSINSKRARLWTTYKRNKGDLLRLAA